MYQANILAGRQELSVSSVAEYHGLAMSAVMIRCQKSYCKEQWMVFLTEEDCIGLWKNNIKEWTGQLMSSLLCIANNKVDGQPSQQRHLLEFPQQCPGVASQKLVCCGLAMSVDMRHSGKLYCKAGLISLERVGCTSYCTTEDLETFIKE